MTEHPDPIPDDLPTCQELLRAPALRAISTTSSGSSTSRARPPRSSSAPTTCLKEEYLALKRLLFGPRRERLPEAPGSNTSSMTMHRRLSR